ncbi:RagB/SusD family nutrient uptake outer membrane protein [Pseudotenacibaculum haliotis]|uniref:RagB/SusD family nutrient uptake outer membrane protein n=1 Tax=Pseudotenacibaculum haliotis TaxID=1862138 RepID=A0ABW5LQR1_9FLAO
MKKLLSILTLSLFVFTSCNDVIDIEQPGTLLAENAFKTVEDLQLGVLGIYNRIDNTRQIRINSVFSDETAIGNDSGGQNSAEYSFVLNSTTGLPATIWNRNYITINQINKILAAAENIPIGAGEQGDYNNAIGELRALRAYTHFMLNTYFSTDYTDDSALGVIALSTIPGLNEDLPRNTNAEVYAMIDADLTAADGLLSNQSSRTFISRDFITALRARMAAYRGQYAAADGYAATLLGSYSIANQTQFFNMWSDTDDTEIIFELERNVGDSYDGQGTGGGGWAGSLYAFVNSTASGSPFMEMSRSLYNKLDEVAGDIRLTRYIDPSSTIDPAYDDRFDDYLVIRKYPGHQSQPLMNDIKIFRSSEMLFIRAEAAANASDLTGAAAYIKQLRDARFGAAQPAPVYASQQEAWAGILAERRLELAFEGHRWVDLKRLGVTANVTIDRDPVNCTIFNACSLSATDHRYTMPIPQSQIDVDPELVQNPGY